MTDDRISTVQRDAPPDEPALEPALDEAAPDDPTAAAPAEPVPAPARLPLARLVPRTGRSRIVAAAVGLALLASAAGFAWWGTDDLPEDAALAVGDTVITVDALDARVQTLGALFGVEPPADPAALDGFRRAAAKSVAVSTVLDRAAADAGIVVAEKQVDDALARYIEQQFGPGGRDRYVEALGVVGTDEAAVRDEIRRQLTVSALMDQVIGEVSVSDADVAAAFAQRRDALGTPEARTLRHIVVGTAPEAEAVLAELRGGRAFEELAAQRSLDGATRATGGALGAVARAQLEPGFGDAAFAAGVGELFGPVPSANGFYVGRVDGIAPPVPAELPQVEGQLRETLRTETALERWRTWLRDTIGSADVVYADDFRPADPDAIGTDEAGLGTDPAGPIGSGPRPAPR